MRALFLALALATAAFPAFAESKPLTKPEVEAIVQTYIQTHGDELLKSIMDWQAKEKQAAIKNIIRPFNPTQGPANAPITIIEFSEYECPFCQKAQDNLKPVRERYKAQIRWVYKHYPLDFHAKAKPAAYAAMAAHKQGKFWEFSNALWPKQAYLSDSLYEQTAKNLKLNMAQFNKDRADKTLQAQLAQDMADGQKVDVQGTPFFLINGIPLSGAQPTEAFIEVIEAELAKKPAK